MIRIFFYPDSTRYVLFTEQVLAHMYVHAQRRPWQKEAGGEIFSAAPNATGLVISAAAGPHPRDHRRRHGWIPDAAAADRARHAAFSLGKHAVGLWHTHPEPRPSPSGLDRQTTHEYLETFQDQRSRYLLVIIGNRGTPVSMGVWAASAERQGVWLELTESAASHASLNDGATDSFQPTK
ncbi:Mov34/MPN/PAD-1 family protein [Azoarcus sp. DD4]|uniref:Mov34/MPN/PAD-1 family protein n=1 Tax=Azoarcus sp. DD4 TaxID=2027405 RepID=UPI001F115898|nr:Mov34/MPN/PAD-1 family protein [Azoarcus sp. DD4]